MNFIKRLIITCALIFLCACNEIIEIELKDMDRDYFVVEALLDDDPLHRQSIALSMSVPYLDTVQSPPVTGASVRIDCSVQGEVLFTESAEMPGLYLGPEGFCGIPEEKYRLTIDASFEDGIRTYTAESVMPQPGFRLDSLDYSFAGGGNMNGLDSLWSLLIWGDDIPYDEHGELISFVKLNGLEYPFSHRIVYNHKYFYGQKIEAFPLERLNQTEANRKQYGDCYKYLEKGDELSITVMTLDRPTGLFMTYAIQNASGMSIPLFTSQPANCPTNISGHNGVGWFAVCPVTTATCIVDDPFKK